MIALCSLTTCGAHVPKKMWRKLRKRNKRVPKSRQRITAPIEVQELIRLLSSVYRNINETYRTSTFQHSTFSMPCILWQKMEERPWWIGVMTFLIMESVCPSLAPICQVSSSDRELYFSKYLSYIHSNVISPKSKLCTQILCRSYSRGETMSKQVDIISFMFQLRPDDMYIKPWQPALLFRSSQTIHHTTHLPSPKLVIN